MKNKVWSNVRKIDSEKLSEIIFERGYTLTGLSTEIGAGDTFLSGVLRKGRMTAKYFKPLCKTLSILPSDIVIGNDEPAENESHSSITKESNTNYKDLDQNQRLIAMLMDIDEAIYKYVNAFTDEGA